MQLLLPTNKVPFSLVLGIKTTKLEKIRVQVSDNRKPNTYYINRQIDVDGYRELNLNFPQSPPAMVLTVFNSKNGNLATNQDKSFIIDKFEPENLEHCPIWMKNDTASFVKFAQEFSENASILSAGKFKPSIYRSDDAKFHIDYYNRIFDRQSKKFLNTPARIGHTSGIIEVAKDDFLKYTVPMRMIILLHEYAHKYLNPTVNKPIAYETGADINALHIYLALGYPPSEAHFAFLHVFKDSNNEQNAKRYHIIKDFIDKFTKGEIEGSCKMKTNISGKQ
jgi:hypothetical protein